MIKKIGITSLLNCFLTFTLAQCNYINYFQFCNDAEINLCRGENEKAIMNYENAFKSVDYPLVKDLYNATVCAAILKQDTLMFHYLEFCLKRGVLLSRFEDNTLVFSDFFESPQWQNIRLRQNVFQKEYLENINSPYKNILEELDELDQKARRRLRFYSSFSKKKQKQIRENVRYVDSINARRIDSLIVLYGYPSEKQLGVGEWFSHKRSVAFFHRTDSLFIYHTEYIALQNGDITPFEYSKKVDYARLGKKEPYYWNMYYDTDITEKDVAEVNNRRKSIGMGSIEEEDEIRSYVMRTKNPYRYYMIVSIKK